MKRIQHENQRGAQFRDRMIRTAFLQVPGALRSRPQSARVTFDNAARGECPSTPWRLDHEAMCATAQAAAEDGRAIVVEDTRARIRAYFEARCAAALFFLPPETDVGVVEAVVRQSEEQGPADVAENLALANPNCRERLLALVHRTRRHISALKVQASAAERAALTAQPTEIRAWR